MKISSLAVNNLRGIRQLTFILNCDSKVIYGENGVGKSTIVEAIDLLLTGKIQRYSGKGTGKLNQNRHGTHVYAGEDTAFVTAEILLPDETIIEITRYIDGSIEPELPEDHPVMTLFQNANSGNHILTRKEILEFVHAIPSTRSEDIQRLLNLSTVENNRKALMKTKNSMKNGLKSAKKSESTALRNLLALLELDKFSEVDVLEKINQRRRIFEVEDLKKFPPEDIFSSINYESLTTDYSLNIDTYKPYFRNLINFSAYSVFSLYSEMETLISDPSLLNEIKEQRQLLKFIEQGLTLIAEETSTCPFCDEAWDTNDLISHLEEKLNSLKSRDTIASQLEENISKIENAYNDILFDLNEILKLEHIDILSHDFSELTALKTRIEEEKGKYNNLDIFVKKLPDEPSTILDENVKILISSLFEYAKETLPTLDKPQTSWDTLTRISERLNYYLDRKAERINAEKASKFANNLFDSFVRSKDNQFDELFSKIEARFIDLYNRLHQSHEPNFSASLSSDDAAVNFEVQFHNGELYPPNAIHSEGHQDSMGICIFLALNEFLNKGKIDLIILDDVVHSVDRDHRKALCKLLTEEFSDSQFIITTHDKLWAQQLRYTGVIKGKKDLIELHDWDIENGPVLTHSQSFLEEFDQLIEGEDRNSAAAKLRRGLEQYFMIVNELIQGKVSLRTDGKWMLGELLDAAYSRLKDLLKKAKNSAHKWNKTELFDSVSDLINQFKGSYEGLRSELWVVNPTVHYSEWADDLKLEELVETKNAIEQFIAYFKCHTCNSLLYLTFNGVKPENLKCRCGDISYNLI